MNIIHTIQRLTGLHPRRRMGEPHYNTAAEVVEAVRHDLIHGRRHTDTVGQLRAAFAKAEADAKRMRELTALSNKG